MITGELQVYKGGGRDLNDVLYQNLPKETEEKTTNLGQDGQCSGRVSKRTVADY
jgi:hypothetical protein